LWTCSSFLDHHEGLVISPIGKEHRLIEAEPDSIMTIWAPEERIAQADIVLAGNPFVANRTYRDVSKATIWAHRRKRRSRNIAAVLARLAQLFVDFRYVDMFSEVLLLKHFVNQRTIVRQEFKIGATQGVPMGSVERVVRVYLQGRVSP
jgi:hypothetical protein